MAYRQSNVRYDITVGGVHLGIADKADGFAKTADVSKYQRESGQKVLGGVADRDTGKATYLYDEAFHAIYRQLDASVGKTNTPAVIGITPIGDDGTPFAGGGFTLVGVCSSLPMPPSDWSSSDGAEVELEFVVSTDLA